MTDGTTEDPSNASTRAGRLFHLAGALLLTWLVPVTSQANERLPDTSRPAANIRSVIESAHFILHTDSDETSAREAVRRMEQSLEFATECWRRPARGKIQCYLVQDLGAWPDGSLPHPLAHVLIRGVGGATLTAEPRDKSRDLHASARGSRQAVIYASMTPGVLEHEVVHAYCVQTFGQTGPEWYKEGMAEMASYGERVTQGVRCPPERLAVLRRLPARSVGEVLTCGEKTQKVIASLGAMWPRTRLRGTNPLKDWTADDDQNIRSIRDEYVYSWALCHLLTHNDNFAKRFRTLGEDYLTRQQSTFDDHFAAMQSELMFEYGFFLRHVQVGFRADLCAWDWKKRFKTLDSALGAGGRIQAKRGWQPSGLIVTAGERFVYRADGTWATNSTLSRMSADGESGGAGRLVGAILHDFQLGAPFSLGAAGSFTATTSGHLYLRCQDAWHELGDNVGDVIVRLTPSADEAASADGL